ncbi:hypothetical protein ACERJO_20850, partial [Halalkalibacter sp. AB-rgal2]|uniref:hypothetical protein n=1 Tax=Halalkalibacter sp. AB-rgal2 TaxID=3242695 RepID=UPI00359E89CE
LSRILLFLALMFFLIFMMWLEIPTEIFVALFSSVISIIIMLDVLKFSLVIDCRRRNKKLALDDYNEKNIYFWSEDLEVDEKFIYKLLNEKSTVNTMENLNKLTKKINDVCSGSLIQLRLLRSYIISKNNSLHNIDKGFKSFLIPITLILSPILVKPLADERITKLIENAYLRNFAYTDYIVMGINLFTFAIFVLLVITYASFIFFKEKRRLKLIIKIIDILIEEGKEDSTISEEKTN